MSQSFYDEVLVPALLMCGTFFVFVVLFLALPVAWLDGHAKSAYLKQTDVPWYQATFLNVQVNSVNAKVQAQTEPKP